MTIFDGRAIARGWLAVAVASGTDNGRPQLHNVEGVVMPVRWDFDANAPRDDETDDDRELAAP